MATIDVPFCSACGKVCDNQASQAERTSWITLRELQTKHGFRPGDLTFHRMFCPSCVTFYRQVQGL